MSHSSWGTVILLNEININSCCIGKLFDKSDHLFDELPQAGPPSPLY